VKEAPKLFDVMPARELHKAMQAALPADVTFAWRHLGNLKVTTDKITVMDPAVYRPGQVLDEEERILDWSDKEAEIWLQVIARKNGDVLRVAAVLVSRALDSAANITKVQVGSSAVDSAQMMVADTARLRSCWNCGGMKNKSVLGRAEEKPKLKKEKERAAVFLANSGFSLTREERGKYLSFAFDTPLTDEQIANIRKLLKDAGINEDVNVIQPHSLAVIEQALDRSFGVSLSDGDSPYLFAFKSGWGDGIYWWDALKQSEKLVGYTCNFMEESEDPR
jgi:hypothetical protein